jgi:hypothetical protein
MGLCINWTLRAPENASAESVTASLLAWREDCLDLPFDDISELMHFQKAEITRRLEDDGDPFRWFVVQACAYSPVNPDKPDDGMVSIDPVEIIGFMAFAGAECEPMNCFLARYPEHDVDSNVARPGIQAWRGSSFTKTQYAWSVAAQHFLKCHLTITAALDAARRAGLLESVLDEGEYWDDRNAEKLLKTVGRWNSMIAGFVGSLELATGCDLPAPIKKNPDFERLEHFGTTSDTAALAKAIAEVLKRTDPSK